jgi:hypothetical protein
MILLFKVALTGKFCVGLSNDAARSMAGSRTGLFARVRAVAPDCVWVHCSIHREAVAVKNMPSLLNSSLKECVKFINYIKSLPLNSKSLLLCAKN